MTGVGKVWWDVVVSVEGTGSLVHIEGYSDFSREPLVLSH